MAEWLSGFGQKMSQEEWAAFTKWYGLKYGKGLPLGFEFTGITPEWSSIYKEYKGWLAQQPAGIAAAEKATEARVGNVAQAAIAGAPWAIAEQKAKAATPVAEAAVPTAAEADEWVADTIGITQRNTKTGKFRWVYDMTEASPEDAARVRQDWLAGLSTGKTDKEMTDFQKAQVGQWGAELRQQQANIVANEQQRAWSSAQQSFMANDIGLQNENAELQRQVDEMQFEKDRANLLQGISVNVGGRIVPGLQQNDWITEHIYRLPNPYTKKEVSPIDELEANLDAETKAGQRWRGELVNAQNAEARGQSYHMTVDEIQDIINTSDEARDKLYATWKDVEKESRDWSPQPVPQPYPNAPGWLPQYVPGLQAGQMITKQEVPTPSGQQLTAMPSNQLEELGYYGKWAGGLTGKYPWEQLTESANLMQPRTPAGAGRASWTPSRQF